MQQEGELFRYQHTFSVFEFVLAEIGLVVLIVCFLACGGGILFTTKDPEFTLTVFAVVLILVSLICVCAVFGVASKWARGDISYLIITQQRVRWSTSGAEGEVEIPRIEMVKAWSGEFRGLTIVMSDGEVNSLPEACLGNLSDFCKVLHNGFANVKVIHNGRLMPQ